LQFQFKIASDSALSYSYYYFIVNHPILSYSLSLWYSYWYSYSHS